MNSEMEFIKGLLYVYGNEKNWRFDDYHGWIFRSGAWRDPSNDILKPWDLAKRMLKNLEQKEISK